MKKVWVVAYRGALVGIYSNRLKVWDALLEAFNTNQQEIKSGSKSLKGEIVISGDWRQRKTCKLQPINLLAVHSISKAFIKSENLFLWDNDDKCEYASVQMTYLNETDLPKLNPEYN